jgi:archaellum component FlaG (FlaF/FlaG flagellin family)
MLMSRRTWSAAAGALAVAVLLGGCGLGFGDEMIGAASATGVQPGPVVPEQPTGTDQAQPPGNGGTTGGTSPGTSATSGSPGSTQPSSGSQVASVTEVRDGIWDVGDAGQVEFRVSNGQLQLMAANPASGWQQPKPAVNQPNQIEVDFSQSAGTTWTFRVQVSGSTMQITKQESIARAGDGSYPVGGAGAVSLINSDTVLKLTNVAPEPGWTVSNQQTSPTSISVSFKRGQGSADFTATKSGSDVTVTTSQQLSGPVPSK